MLTRLHLKIFFFQNEMIGTKCSFLLFVQNKNERDRIENLNDREDLPPTNRSSKPVSGNDDFPKMEEFIDADVQKSPVKSLKITSNLNGLQGKF